jgi:hypothetical protein
MLKKTNGKAVLNRLTVALRVTGPDGKQSEKVVYEKETVKSLTMLDLTGLVVLTMFQHVLFQGMLTELGNPKGEAEND